MKNSKLLTATAVFSVAITAAVTTMSLTSAYRGNTNQDFKPSNKIQISAEQREAMHEALKNKDYDAWVENAPADGRHSDLTQAEFEELAEKHLEKIESREERKELREARKAALDEVFANNDYEGWKELMTESGKNSQILEVINADNFDKLIEIHNLKKEGKAKFEEAQALMQELGIEKNFEKQGSHKGKGLGMRKGNFGGTGFNQ